MYLAPWTDSHIWAKLFIYVIISIWHRKLPYIEIDPLSIVCLGQFCHLRLVLALRISACYSLSFTLLYIPSEFQLEILGNESWTSCNACHVLYHFLVSLPLLNESVNRPLRNHACSNCNFSNLDRGFCWSVMLRKLFLTMGLTMFYSPGWPAFYSGFLLPIL